MEPLKIDFAFVGALTAIGRAVSEMQATWQVLSRPLLEGFADVFRDTKKADAVLAAGWVPHPTMPMGEIDAEIAPAEIDRILTNYYRENWDSARSALSASVKASGIDEEAKATFEEGLSAHEAGLYRSVVRLLFPEIERVTRDTVHSGNRRGPLKSYGTKSMNANLSAFREALLSELPPHLVLDMPFALSLIGKLSEHLYEWVPARDPVPNRHASQHGFVSYSTMQNSWNMLAMTDFMFNVIMRANAYMDRGESD